jgi:hypothetical protein
MTRGLAYAPPGLHDFCDSCGAPLPWASRQARIYELENLLDADESVEEATRVRVREELERLARDDESDMTEETKRWQRVQRLWPGMASMGQVVLTSVLTAEMKRMLGLPS